MFPLDIPGMELVCVAAAAVKNSTNYQYGLISKAYRESVLWQQRCRSYWIVRRVQYIDIHKYFPQFVFFSLTHSRKRPLARSLSTENVSVITADGRNIVGHLKGYDQHMNLIMEGCHERVYSSDTGVEQVDLGLYIIRGDNMYVCNVYVYSRSRSTSYPFSHAFPFYLAHTTHTCVFFYVKNRAIVGEIDKDVDAQLDLSSIRAEPFEPVIH